MAMSVAVTQPLAAMVGQPCTFVATVSNSSGANVNLNSLNAVVALPNGQIYAGANVNPPQPSAQTSVAQNGGYQFNVVIPASGSVVFTFQVVLIGHRTAGATAAAPDNSYFIRVDCSSSDGSNFSATAPVTNANLPTFGPALSSGTPSNQSVGAFPTFGTAAAAPAQPGTMSFQVSSNAVLAL